MGVPARGVGEVALEEDMEGEGVMVAQGEVEVVGWAEALAVKLAVPVPLREAEEADEGEARDVREGAGEAE